MEDLKERLKKPHKSLYILPSLFTLINMAMGYYAIIAALDGKWIVASAVITIGVLMDGLDGRVARATHTTSEFGLNFDSIVDVISFGVAPAIIVYLYCLRNFTDFKHLGWILSFIYVAAGAMRLARFNVQAKNDLPNTFFIGLPIPGAAGVLSTMIWIFEKHFKTVENAQMQLDRLLPVTMFLLSYLMISKIRYYSFKKIKIIYKKPALFIIFMAALIYALFVYPSIVLFTIGIIYALSGPIRAVFSLSRFISRKKQY